MEQLELDALHNQIIPKVIDSTDLTYEDKYLIIKLLADYELLKSKDDNSSAVPIIPYTPPVEPVQPCQPWNPNTPTYPLSPGYPHSPIIWCTTATVNSPK